jgi:hypothetical protein
MIDLNKLHPIKIDDLIRIGNKYDGGYIISKKMIEYTKILLSFGIRDDFTFEEEFFYKKNIKIYSYDYSTLKLININYITLIYRFFRSCLGIIYHFIRLNPMRSKIHFNKIAFKTNFYNFFNTKRGKYFIPKFIGNNDDQIYITVDTIFNNLNVSELRYGGINDLSIFIKMDIEGDEYNILNNFKPYYNKINGLVIEFHNIDKNDIKFNEILNELLQIFYIAHIHGCNYSRFIENMNISSAIELTFINKKICNEEIILSRKQYPIKNLDSPCNPYKKDILIKFK